MGKQALYVVPHLGRDRFIWAVSAREAREEAAAAPESHDTTRIAPSRSSKP